jgi:hypothetical protein
VVLDQGRVQVERHRLPPEQRLHTPKQAVKSAVELTDVTEVEAREKPPQRGRVRHRVTAQLLLRRVGTQQRRIVETLAADDQRLAQRQHLLRRRRAARTLLHRHRVQQLANTERARQLTHQHQPRIRRHLLR